MKAIEKGFLQGLGFAIAWLHKWHDVGTPIEEMYNHAGFDLSEFERCCEAYDFESIREVAAAAGRRGKPIAQPTTAAAKNTADTME